MTTKFEAKIKSPFFSRGGGAWGKGISGGIGACLRTPLQTSACQTDVTPGMPLISITMHNILCEDKENYKMIYTFKCPHLTTETEFWLVGNFKNANFSWTFIMRGTFNNASCWDKKDLYNSVVKSQGGFRFQKHEELLITWNTSHFFLFFMQKIYLW